METTSKILEEREKAKRHVKVETSRVPLLPEARGNNYKSDTATRLLKDQTRSEPAVAVTAKPASVGLFSSLGSVKNSEATLFSKP